MSFLETRPQLIRSEPPLDRTGHPMDVSKPLVYRSELLTDVSEPPVKRLKPSLVRTDTFFVFDSDKKVSAEIKECFKS